MSTIAVTARPYTPDDLRNLPDGDHEELVDGRLVTRHNCMTSSFVAGRIIRSLLDACGSPRLAYVLPGHGYACFPGRPNTIRRPDVSLILAERLTPAMFQEAFTSVRPDLAAEVVSPTDTVYDLRGKLADYRDAEIPLVWVVHPPTRSVEVIRPGGVLAELGPDGELSGGEVLPGFRCRVADLFAGLPAAEQGG